MTDNVIRINSEIENWAESKFECGSGTVIVNSSDGHLTVERALFLLEMAKQEILAAWSER